MPFVGTSLIDDAGSECDELSEISAVKLELLDLFAGDRRADFRRSCFDLRNAFAGDDDFFADSTNSERNIDAGFFRDAEDDVLCGKFLKAFCGDDEIVGIARQARDHVCAVTIGNGGTRDAAGGVLDRYIGAGNCSARFVCDRAADVSGVLGARSRRDSKESEQSDAKRQRSPPKASQRNRRNKMCLHG